MNGLLVFLSVACSHDQLHFPFNQNLRFVILEMSHAKWKCFVHPGKKPGFSYKLSLIGRLKTCDGTQS